MVDGQSRVGGLHTLHHQWGGFKVYSSLRPRVSWQSKLQGHAWLMPFFFFPSFPSHIISLISSDVSWNQFPNKQYVSGSISGGTQTKAALFFLSHLFCKIKSTDNYENIKTANFPQLVIIYLHYSKQFIFIIWVNPSKKDKTENKKMRSVLDYPPLSRQENWGLGLVHNYCSRFHMQCKERDSPTSVRF